MSHTIIEALFNGKIAPWSRPESSEPAYQALAREIERAKLYFTKDMSFKEREQLEELERLFMRKAYDEEVEIYTHGFVQGALLMLEITENRDVVFRQIGG